MLQNIGDILKGQRWLAFLVLGLLILVFALWGTYGIVDLTFGAPKYGLKVNGEEVPASTLQQAWQERQSQYQQQTRDGHSAGGAHAAAEPTARSVHARDPDAPARHRARLPGQ